MTPEPERDTADGGPYTLDAFHRGAFHLVQPRGKGHRAGMDALVLAASVPGGFAGRLADFGAGAGAAGMAVASRCSGAEVVLVERAAPMLDCARRTLALPANARLAARITVLAADVGLAGAARQAAGLADASFDHVIMNPPFNAPEDRASPDLLRREAHVMDDDLFETWVRSAAAVARPRCGISIIARPASISALLAALDGRFGGAQILPLQPEPNAAAIRIVVRAAKGSRAGPSLWPALVLQEARHGPVTDRAGAIANGLVSLFGD